MPGRRRVVLVTCEHAGRDVPPGYAHLFEGAEDVLASHRGADIGALGVALRLAERLAAPLLFSRTTRLLVELNRAADNQDWLSEYSRRLSAADRADLAATHYTPYRSSVERWIGAAAARADAVLHVSTHSFVDVLDGVARDVDIGLLYDPARRFETGVVASWGGAIERASPRLRVRHNEPYLGTDDGLTTFLRTRFPDPAYAGIELEVRQGLLADPDQQRRVADLLADTLPRISSAMS